MTSVNVTTTKNTVTVNGETRVVTVKTQGPQGPSLPDGDKGDVTVSSNGTAISINNSAVTSAKIADGAIVDADINASAAIALTKLATGALPTAITVTSANISDLSIVDADISASAAISLSKLATGALPTAITVTSANISDLSIVNADINASAAIAGTKISPDFGSQNIITTGTAATGALGVTGNLTVSGTVDGVDVATRDALFGGLTSSSGVLSNGVTATTQSASDNSTKIATTAYTDTAISNLINGAPAALDTLNELAAALNDDAAFSTTVTNSIATKMPLAGGQFTGNVTFSGTQTVDGRDLSVDGAKLDGIESGATADQTAAEIRALVESASDSNVFTDADHSKLNGIEASATADQTKSDIDALGIAASTATTLATARTIAGVSFDGSADISLNNNAITNGAGYITATLTNEQVQDIVGGMLTGNTESGITVTYQDGDGTIDFVVNQDTTGNAATATALETARTIAGTSFDGSANIDISYTNLTNKLSVGDGGLTQNNFTDALKNKLDGIEALATADQTAAEIKTLFNSNGLVNAQIDASAAIAGTKISPDFGSQTITTTGALNANGNVFVSNGEPRVFLTDTGQNPDYILSNTNGLFKITQSDSGDADKIVVNANGHVDINDNLDVSGGVDVTGNITVTGTVDGRDVATDGTKLDGIETGATADQTAAEIKTLLNSNGIVNAQIDASAAIAGTKISPNFGSQNLTANVGTFSNLNISSTNPYITFTDTNHDSDFGIYGSNGLLKIYDNTNSVNRLTIASDGTVNVLSNLDVGAGIDVTGDITVTGTVDGVDVAARNTLFGGLTSSSGVLSNGVTATTQSASDNSTKVATTAYADTAVANLVDSAPGTLNTLNELAAALGDDPNFATTVTNSIATKLPLAGGTLTGDLTISNASPSLNFVDSGENPDYKIRNQDGTFRITDTTNNAGRFVINTDGHIDIAGNVDFGAGIDVTGNITVSGTVDGRDIATDGTKLDGIESNATADQTASEIVALVADQTIAPSEIDMEDNEKIKLGTGDDLQIYHDGTTNVIAGFTESDISIESYFGADVNIVTNSNHYAIKCISNAQVELYYDNVKRLETKSWGVEFIGDLENNSDSSRIKLGAGDDLQIYHDGSNSIIEDTGTGQLRLCGDNAVVLRKSPTGDVYALGNADGNFELFYDNSKKLETTSGGVEVQGYFTAGKPADYWATTSSYINVSNYGGLGSHGAYEVTLTAGGYRKGSSQWEDYTVNSQSGYAAQVALNPTNGNIIFRTQSGKSTGDSSAVTERMRIHDTGEIQLPDNGKFTCGAANDLQIYHDGSNSYIKDTGTGQLRLATNEFLITNAAVSENMFKIFENGAVELYYDASKKLETTASGIQIASAGTGRTLYIEQQQDADSEAIAIRQFGTESQSATNVSFLNHSGNEIGSIESSSSAVDYKTDDGGKFVAGTGDDLQIYHDGSHSRIYNSTGNLSVRSALFEVLNADGSEHMFKATADAGCELLFNGNVKLSTRTGDTLFHDDIRIQDNNKINIGTGDDLQIYHDGTNSLLVNSTGDLRIRGNSLKLQSTTGEEYLRGTADAGVDLFYDNVVKFSTNTDGYRCNDNVKAQFGDGSDLKIYHNGSNSYIEETGTGILGIQSSEVQIGNAASNKVGAKFLQNAAVELYYDNAKRFETTAGGTIITGTLDVTDTFSSAGNIKTGTDTGKFFAGASNDLQIYHDGSASYIDNSTGIFYIRGNGTNSLRIRPNPTENSITCNPNAAVELYYDNSKKFETNTGGAQVFGNLYLADTVGLWLGDSSDLKIYHDGSHSYIKNTTGHLRIGDANVVIMNAACDEDMIHAKQNEGVELYYDNSKKFETTSDGATVTGSLGIGTTSPDVKLDVARLGNAWTGQDPIAGTVAHFHNGNNGSSSPAYLGLGAGTASISGINFGDADDADVGEILYSHVDDSLRFQTNTAERVRIDSAGRVLIGTTTEGEASADDLTIAGSGNQGITIRSGTSNYGLIYFSDATSGTGEYDGAIEYKHDDNFMVFRTGSTERMRILGDGSITTNGNSSLPTGSTSGFGFSSDQFYLSYPGTGANYSQRFYNGNGLVGSILVNGSSTTYNTSSDYRLKENVVTLSDGITRLKKLKPYKFNFIADRSTTFDGFFAHEAQAIVPESATGVKDEVDENNDPVYQGIDQSKLVPLLVAAVQELIERVEKLEGA